MVFLSQGGICSFPGGYWSQMGRKQQLAFRLYTSLLSSIVWVQKMQACCFDTACAVPQWLYPGCLFVGCQHLKSARFQLHPTKSSVGFSTSHWRWFFVVFFPDTVWSCLSPEQYPPQNWWFRFPRIRINALPFKLSFFVRNLPFDVFFQVLHLRFSSMDWILGGKSQMVEGNFLEIGKSNKKSGFRLCKGSFP